MGYRISDIGAAGEEGEGGRRRMEDGDGFQIWDIGYRISEKPERKKGGKGERKTENRARRTENRSHESPPISQSLYPISPIQNPRFL